MAKQISFNAEARERLKAGIDAMANAVKLTLGPKGRNVVIQKSFGAPSPRAYFWRFFYNFGHCKIGW